VHRSSIAIYAYKSLNLADKITHLFCEALTHCQLLFANVMEWKWSFAYMQPAATELSPFAIYHMSSLDLSLRYFDVTCEESSA